MIADALSRLPIGELTPPLGEEAFELPHPLPQAMVKELQEETKATQGRAELSLGLSAMLKTLCSPQPDQRKPSQNPALEKHMEKQQCLCYQLAQVELLRTYDELKED